MKKIFFIFILLISYACAFDKVALEYGGKDSLDVYGIALQKDFDYKLFDVADLGLDVELQKLDGDDDDITVLSTQGLFSFDITKDFFFQAGLGVSYFSKEHLDHKKLGMHFQFKESAGFGYKFNDKIEATLKYNHYSNASLDDDNAGVDFIGLKVGYKF